MSGGGRATVDREYLDLRFKTLEEGQKETNRRLRDMKKCIRRNSNGILELSTEFKGHCEVSKEVRETVKEKDEQKTSSDRHWSNWLIAAGMLGLAVINLFFLLRGG